MALERMPFDVQTHKVDILVITFGMNDCNYWKTDQGLPRVSPDAFEANMKEIIMRGFRFGSRTVIILIIVLYVRSQAKIQGLFLLILRKSCWRWYQRKNIRYQIIPKKTEFI